MNFASLFKFGGARTKRSKRARRSSRKYGGGPGIDMTNLQKAMAAMKKGGRRGGGEIPPQVPYIGSRQNQ